MTLQYDIHEQLLADGIVIVGDGDRMTAVNRCRFLPHDALGAAAAAGGTAAAAAAVAAAVAVAVAAGGFVAGGRLHGDRSYYFALAG